LVTCIGHLATHHGESSASLFQLEKYRDQFSATNDQLVALRGRLVESSYQFAAYIFQPEIARGELENGRGKLADVRDQLETCSDQLSDAIFRLVAFEGLSSPGNRRPSLERNRFARRGGGIVVTRTQTSTPRVTISPSFSEKLSELVLFAESIVQKRGRARLVEHDIVPKGT
jgi:hypothetical protein